MDFNLTFYVITWFVSGLLTVIIGLLCRYFFYKKDIVLIDIPYSLIICIFGTVALICIIIIISIEMLKKINWNKTIIKAKK